MRQTLCYIPETCYGIPVFGWGWGLGFLIAFVIVTHCYQYLRYRKIYDIDSSLALLGIGGAVFVFVIPHLAEPGLGIPIRGYGFCLLIAIFAALALVVHLAKRQSIATTEKVYSLCFWTIIAGIVSARLFYVTEYWQHYLFDSQTGQPLQFHESLFRAINFPDGGITVFGAILGGILGAVIFMFRNNMPVFRTFDVMAPAVALGMAIGRIGCLLNGCCFGDVTDLSWGIVFPPGSPVHDYQIAHSLVPYSSIVLPVHPTQIYSSCLALLLCGTLLFLGRLPFYRQRAGLVFASFMLLYSVGRFMIEFVRTDEDSFLGTGLTISQNVSIVFFVMGIALFMYVVKRR